MAVRENCAFLRPFFANAPQSRRHPSCSDLVQPGHADPVKRGRDMSSIEERVAFLEGRFADDAAATAELRTSVDDLRNEMHTRFVRVEANAGGLRCDMNARFAALDQKLDRQFGRLFVQVAVLLAVSAAVVGVFFK
jgi:hypothetical protein